MKSREDSPDKVRILAETNLFDYTQTRDAVEFAWRVAPVDGAGTTASGTVSIAEDKLTELLLPGKELAEGKYKVEVALREKTTGKVLAEETCPLTRLQ